MDKTFKFLNLEATIADILSAQEDEFNSFINKLKNEYKKQNQIKAKPKAQKPLNFVLQHMRKMSQHYMKKCGAWGRKKYLDMNMLLDSVCEQHEDELKTMGYSQKSFLLDFSSEVAVLMTSGIFQRSYTFPKNGVWCSYPKWRWRVTLFSKAPNTTKIRRQVRRRPSASPKLPVQRA